MIGQSLAHYRITAAIGAGGMGAVYRATDTRLGRDVALKVLPPEMASMPERLDRFRREAKALAALDHPGIVTVYSVEEADGVHFLTMQLVEGESLDRLIDKAGMPIDRILSIAAVLVEAIAAAHDKGIIHRDLKPANVMVSSDGRVKVLDFGLARMNITEPSGDSRLSTDLRTRDGVVMGTAAYMSPEQITGRELDYRTDIFSLGIILYEMTSGRRPFKGSSSAELASAILRDTPRSLTELRGGLPENLQRAIERCLEKSAAKRFSSARELSDALRAPRGASSSMETAVTPTARPQTGDSGGARADEGLWIAVLPFNCVGPDADIAALSDGLSEEIVTGLSRFRYLSVVASSSAARLKGVNGDERERGARLGARYVVEGSIRGGGSAIRVSAQLVDTQTGAQLWSETYRRDLQTSSALAVQDDIAARIVATVADSYGVLVHAMRDAIRKKDDVNLTPAEWQFQYFAYREQITPSNHAELKIRLESVAERTRKSEGWACLAQIYVDEYAFGFPGHDGKSLDRALVAARRGVELDRANQFAMVALAQTHFFRQDLAAFGPAAERAMALNPLNTDALGILGLEIVHTGEFERGTAIVRRAMELNANHAGWMHFAPLWDHFHQGEYEQALECANRVDVPGLFWPFLVMASACGHLGRRTEAKAALRDLLVLDPEFAAHARSNIGSWHFASGLMDPILEGLRKAGLEIPPENKTADPTPDLARSSEADSGAVRAGEGFWVAVLPFRYSGANTDLTSLAEGLTEDIVTGLSRFSYLRVIARSSTSRYVNESVDVRTAGKDLGARYVMEGSLRQAGTNLRLAVQLVDAESGAHLWAENYERTFSPETIFELQDDLVPRIVSTVADVHGVLPRSMSGALQGRAPEQLSPHEAVLRSFGYVAHITAEEHAEVRAGLERAVETEPANSEALAMLSTLYADEYKHGFNAKPDPLGRALEMARRAVAAAPSNHLAYHSLAEALFFRKEFPAFRIAAERALALNPMDGNTIAFMGILLAYAGDWERGLPLAQRAMELNPNHPGWYRFVVFNDAFRKGDYPRALDVALKFDMPGYFQTHVALAAVYGQLGERDAGRNALRELSAQKPDYGVVAREDLGKWMDPDLVERLVDGLRKAGLEIPASQQGDSAVRIGLPPAQLTGTVSSMDTEEAATEVRNPGRTADIETHKSIAVLPFTNMSKDEDNEYFCEGLAEELLNALSKIDHLKVAARTSAFSFKGRNASVSEIGEKLGVKTVFEGSVRKSGNKLRISVQLVAVSDGFRLWSERYDREMKDIFDVQDEIALAVVEALKLTLFKDEKAAVLKRHTEDAEVHEWFLKGRYHANKYTPEGWTRAIEAFEKAIERQPDHAPSWAGTALSRGCLWFFGTLPADETVPQCKAASFKALSIDENLPDAHLSMAMISFFHDWEWERAEKEFKQSIALNPNNAEALSYYAMFLAFEGRFDEAISRSRLSLEIDPLSPLINMNVGWTYFSAGMLDEALSQTARMIEMEPEFFGAYWLKGAIDLSEGRYEEAVEQLEEAVSLGGRQIVLADLGSAFSLSGNNDEASATLEQLLEMRRQHYAPAICLARMYIRIGETEKGIDWLEKAFEERNGEMVFLQGELAGAAESDPLKSLADHPRVIDLLRRMDLPESLR